MLQGARHTLRARTPVVIFEADDNMAGFGYTHRDLFALLREPAPYSFYRIGNGEWVPVNTEAENTPGDYVALPPGWRQAGNGS